MTEEAQAKASELAEIMESMRNDLERAISLASDLQENTDIQVLSSVEVMQFGAKSAARELPDA